MAVSCWRHILQCTVFVWSFLRLLKLRKLAVLISLGGMGCYSVSRCVRPWIKFTPEYGVCVRVCTNWEMQGLWAENWATSQLQYDVTPHFTSYLFSCVLLRSYVHVCMNIITCDCVCTYIKCLHACVHSWSLAAGLFALKSWAVKLCEKTQRINVARLCFPPLSPPGKWACQA